MKRSKMLKKVKKEKRVVSCNTTINTKKGIILLALFLIIFVVGCKKERIGVVPSEICDVYDGLYDDADLIFCNSIASDWKAYKLTAPKTCDDFNYIWLSLQVSDERCVQTMNREDAVLSHGYCNIPIFIEWEINKEYCNFKTGDIIWTYP